MGQPKLRDNLLTIWESLFLAIGATIGLCWVGFLITGYPSLLTATNPKTWGLFLYAGLSGMTMSGTVLLLVNRFRKPRRWRTGAFLLCVIGLGCWAFAPMLLLGAERYFHLAGVTTRLSDFLPAGAKSRAVPYAEAFFFNVLPLFSLLMMLTTMIGGRPVRRWWKCRGWWPEWFGMYVVAAWSLAGLWVIYRAYAIIM